MKKFYNKPAAELVDFSLTSSIANNCGGVGGNGGVATAASSSGSVFADECEYPLECYHVPCNDTSVAVS